MRALLGERGLLDAKGLLVYFGVPLGYNHVRWFRNLILMAGRFGVSYVISWITLDLGLYV